MVYDVKDKEAFNPVALRKKYLFYDERNRSKFISRKN